MQAVKDKLHDMSEMRKAKAEAKAEEKVIKKKYHMMIIYKQRTLIVTVFGVLLISIYKYKYI